MILFHIFDNSRFLRTNPSLCADPDSLGGGGVIHVFVYYCLDKQCILFLAFQPLCEHAKTRLRLSRLISMFCYVFLPGNKTKGSDKQ